MRGKRAVELTLETIVIFILILLILGVSVYFIAKSSGNLIKTTDCKDRGYTCVAKSQCAAGKEMPVLSCKSADGKATGEVCCITD